MTDNEFLKALHIAADEDAEDAASEIAMLSALNDKQAGQILELLRSLYDARLDEEKQRDNAQRWRNIAFSSIIYGFCGIAVAVLRNWGR